MIPPLTLDQAKVGEKLLIKAILDDETATIAMRLGVSEGELVSVASKIPGGPLVIRQGGMEIALGRALCRGIEVERLEEKRK
jgi:Fe2+ transport system protein FeoA